MVLSKTKTGLNSLASAEFNRINVSETAHLLGHWEALERALKERVLLLCGGGKGADVWG
jgi:hypothetical protein